MFEKSYLKIFPKMPKTVSLGDITIREGFQHEDRFIPTEKKKDFLDNLVFAGAKELEITNLGNPKRMPQFQDADDLLSYVNSEDFFLKCEKYNVKREDLTFTAVTIRERAVDRAVELKKQGRGPDRILMMVSTDENHHFTNSGTTLTEYWAEAQRCIQKAHDVGIKFCGTVSTIWGSPISGATDMRDALAFTKRWLDLGADDIEHADHDGSANAMEVYAYFSEVLEKFPNPKLHLAHFHETRRTASASLLASLHAGIYRFEATLGGIGGMPATKVDGLSCGIGDYYFEDSEAKYVGLICLEDGLVFFEGLGIHHGYDTDKILLLGQDLEKYLERRLRSEAIFNGRVKKEGHREFIPKGLLEKKKALNEL